MQVGLSLALTGGGRVPAPALTTWDEAFANRATTPPRILCVGDSTTAGVNGGSTAGLFAESYPVELAAKFNASGYDAQIDSFLGHNVGGGTGAIATYDPRRSFGAGWTLASTTAGGQAFRNNSDATVLSFEPGASFDQIDVWTLRNSGLGSLDVGIDGGAAVATINQAGTAAMIRTTIDVTPGLHSVDFTRVSGDTYVIGVETRDTSAPKIEVLNAGWSSSRASQWVVATQPWNPINAIATLEPDLTVINLGLNDINPTYDEATFRTNMQALITKAKTVGDVILMVPNPASTASRTIEGQDMIRRVVHGLAATNSLRVVDIRARWGGSYETAVADGFMDEGETLHPNAAGYADMAQAVYETLA